MSGPAATPVLHIVCERDVGLFNLVLGVIAHIHWARSEGRIPVVFLGRNCCYWTPLGYRGRDSVWEYYFEPLVPEYPAERIPPHIRQWIADHPRLKDARDRFVDEASFVSRDGAWQVRVDGELVRGPMQGSASRTIRELTSTIVRDFVRPRDYIIDKAERFARQHMADRFVIGVHIRGTDAIGHRHKSARQRRVDIDEYCAAVRRCLSRHPDALILVASDTHDYVRRMQEAFAGRVIAYDSIRHEDGVLAGTGPLGGSMPAFLTHDRDRAARSGEEAVIEYLLLCRCNHLVHNLSAIPRAVMLSVPDMPETNIAALSPLDLVMASLRTTVDRWLRTSH